MLSQMVKFNTSYGWVCVCVCARACVCVILIPSSADGHSGGCCTLAVVVVLQWTLQCMCLFELEILFSSDKYPAVGTAESCSVQPLSCVRLFVTPWTAARQASLSITNSRSSFKLRSIESVMPSSHLILCRPLLLLPPIPPSIRVF